MNVTPISIGAQNDSNGKIFSHAAMRKVAHAIGEMHFVAGDDQTRTSPPMHLILLVILDEVVTQTNDHGGGLKHNRAEKAKLTIVAHANDLCEHILGLVAEQYNNDPDAEKQPCINHMIVKTRETSLLKNVDLHIASQYPQNQPSRNSEPNMDVQNSMTPAAPGHDVVGTAYFPSQGTPATADESNVPESIDGDKLSVKKMMGLL